MTSFGNSLDNVDFLVAPPEKSDYPIPEVRPNGYESKEAFVTFTGNFNKAKGEFSVKKYGETSYLCMEYVNEPKFVTYLFTYDYKNNPKFYINDVSHERATETIIS